MTGAVVARLESVAVAVGAAVARLGIPIVILSIAFEPLARWTGWGGELPASEISTLAFLAATMTSFGYGYVAGAHVRLDILSSHFGPRLKAAIELVATLFILIPLCLVVVIDGVDSTWRSLVQAERWGDSAWAVQWTVRLWVPVGFALLMAAALAAALRCARILFRK